MRVEQIAVFLENKSGRLAEITRILAENDINIRALSVADTADFGILRLIVDKVDLAKEVLRSGGFTVGKTNVIAVDGGATGNSANTSATGTLWFAWGHTSTAGTDPDHPYTPSPWATPQVTPFGPGWIGDAFSIPAFEPCDKKNNCIP